MGYYLSWFCEPEFSLETYHNISPPAADGFQQSWLFPQTTTWLCLQIGHWIFCRLHLYRGRRVWDFCLLSVIAGNTHKILIIYCLTLCPLGNFSCFFVVCWFFSKSTFSKNSFRNTYRVSNRLDPDQAWHYVRPDLGQNCLQKLSADDTRR